jgi:ketosteroid isomerase-like protein
MTSATRFLLVFVGTVCLANLSWAQDLSQVAADDRADVWTTVEAQWNAQEKGDSKWPDTYLAEDFSGWDTSSPAPRGKSSTKMWNRFNEKVSEMLAHELYPLSIVVAGDTGIAHYLYSSASKDNDGKITTVNGRYTDILIRTADGWKFIAWQGGDDK